MILQEIRIDLKGEKPSVSCSVVQAEPGKPPPEGRFQLSDKTKAMLADLARQLREDFNSCDR
jgi:hypothetical protein